MSIRYFESNANSLTYTRACIFKSWSRFVVNEWL